MQIRAQVFKGAVTPEANVTSTEPWIREALQKAGSAVTPPLTPWLELHGTSHLLLDGNGFFINGKVTQRQGKYHVDIHGCAGCELKAVTTLQPGQRRLLPLVDGLGAKNIFVAVAVPVTQKAATRAQALQANAKNLVLTIRYYGRQDKPFYQLVASVPEPKPTAEGTFTRTVAIDPQAAKRLIDHLSHDTFLDRALDRRTVRMGPPIGPCYTLQVTTGGEQWYENLGWGLPMLQRLDGIKDALPAPAQRDMNLLLGRLSGLRKQWEAASDQKK